MMGKNKDKAAKTETKVEEKAEKKPEFKFGVTDLAELMDSEAATVRVKLRSAGIEKAGKSYGWNTQADLKEVAATLKAATKKEAKAEKADAKTDKPAKGKKGAAAKEPEPAAEPEKKSKKDKKKDKAAKA